MVIYRLGTKESEKDKIAKTREKTRDLSHVKCIKIEDEKVLTQDDEILNRWMEYFSKLLNETYASDVDFSEDNCRLKNCSFHRRISIKEVK